VPELDEVLLVLEGDIVGAYGFKAPAGGLGLELHGSQLDLFNDLFPGNRSLENEGKCSA
jgi:hypothetical protein